MTITNYGFFTYYEDAANPGLVPFKNTAGQDWYELRSTLMQWDFANHKLTSSKHARYAMVDANNVVTNVETDPSMLMPGDRTVLGIDGATTVEPGMIYAGNTFVPAPEPEPVFAPVTMRQAKLALSRAGLLAQVNAAIAGMEGQAGEEAQIEWEYGSEVYRDSDLMLGIAGILGMTPNDIDGLFKTAATL